MGAGDISRLETCGGVRRLRLIAKHAARARSEHPLATMIQTEVQVVRTPLTVTPNLQLYCVQYKVLTLSHLGFVVCTVYR